MDENGDTQSVLSRFGVLSRWLVLIVLSIAYISILRFASIPASLLLGAMAAGITVSLLGGTVGVPKSVLLFSQAWVGCMIAGTISAETLKDILGRWPLLILMVVSVTAVASFLGWMLAKTRVLPGTTAIWGTSPGAALLMTIMSENYGADSRLVAFMQYYRVLLVTLVATGFGGAFGEHHSPILGIGEKAGFNAANLSVTLLIAVCGMLLGKQTRFPSAPMLFPIIAGSLVNVSGIFAIVQPQWLLSIAYSVVGWSIGLRFSRSILSHAYHGFSRVTVVMIAMIAICFGIAVFFSWAADIDLLTAYLATSPGGMDSVAIIAATTGGNVSLVMSVQTLRFIIVTLTGPALATFIVKKIGLDFVQDSTNNNGSS